ncbi:MAG: PilN domain-containing protein [Deltaproteobacteria bacterium]|nr:PilN domain-containing protein [Deltaproteobacteria bacterium]
MNGSIIALNMTPEDIKLAEINLTNGEKRVSRLYHYRPGNADEKDNISATEVIKRLFQEKKPKTLKTLLVINSQDLDYRDFSFPFDSRKKVTGAIGFEISSEYPPNDYIVDYIKSITREPGTKSFLAAIAGKEVLRKRIKEAEDAGLRIVGITSDISTLGNYVRDENEALVMEMGEGQTLFSLFTHGVPILVRDIPIGIKEINKGSEGTNNDGLRPLMGEIKRTLHSFNAKTGLDLSRIYVSGNILAQQEILKRLNEELEFDFVDQTPQGREFKCEKPRDDLNMYASVLGAAEWKRRDRSFNFFKDDLVLTEPGAIRRSYLRWGSLILFSFFLTLLLSLWVEITALENRKTFLDTKTKEIFMSTFPQAKRIVDAVRQAKNFLDTGRSGSDGNTLSVETSILDALKVISQAIPEETSFQIMSIRWERGRLEMNGKTDSFKTVNTIQELLTGSQSFSEVNISNAKLGSDGQDVEFKITIRLAG